ncbi:metal-dependent transcriptional regulator [bacterium]|nr:metal-dependent transcriptional regulator [bacterium]MCP5461697.1 metal-dependent transcriptional regulator [bacterium]
MPSESIENYLKAVYELDEANIPVTTSSLAEKLKISPASVTGMLKRLSTKRPLLIEYASHQTPQLTAMGKKTALSIIRQHRLIELFLHKSLDIPWDKLHSEAEKLEHCVSEYLEDKIDSYLGYPRFDPHGAPIPAKDGSIPPLNYIPLSELPTGTESVVKRVMKDDPDLLTYLTKIGLVIGTYITINEIVTFDNTLIVTIGSSSKSKPTPLGKKIADHIFVENPAK